MNVCTKFNVNPSNSFCSVWTLWWTQQLTETDIPMLRDLIKASIFLFCQTLSCCMNACKPESIYWSLLLCVANQLSCVQTMEAQVLSETDFLRKMLLCTTVLFRRLQWHTKWNWMFPWHSALKWGWCRQQSINAWLTFSVTGIKLGTSNMATSVIRIFSHLFMSLDISKKTDLYLTNQVSH